MREPSGALGLRAWALKSVALLPSLVIVFYWPILLMINLSSDVSKLYYKLAFRLNYHFVRNSAKQLKQELFQDLEQVASTSKGIKLLEIGPGNGSNFAYYPDKTQLTTFEHGENLLENVSVLREKIDKVQFAKAIVADCAKLSKFKSNSMDVIVATHVLCCLKDQEATMREMLRILKPGGRFYFFELVRYSDHDSRWKSMMQVRALESVTKVQLAQ